MILSVIQTVLAYRPIRYLVAGGTAAVVHIGIVFVFTHYFNIWYVYATTTGFVCALSASFILQKFFTFRDHRTRPLGVQSSIFISIALFNLLLNNAAMYFLVESFSLLPVVAQFLTSGAIAIWSYIAYSRLFKVAAPLLGEEDGKE